MYKKQSDFIARVYSRNNQPVSTKISGNTAEQMLTVHV